MDSERLHQLDSQFIEFYEAARYAQVEGQKGKALIIIEDGMLLLYHRNLPVLEFPGLRPELYTKLKTMGHVPLAIYCLLHDHAGKGELPGDVSARAQAYRDELEAFAPDFDLTQEIAQGTVARNVEIPTRATAFLNQILSDRQVSVAGLNEFVGLQARDIGTLLAGAARAQLDACHQRVMQIKHEILSQQEWSELRVLVMGAYMARQGELFLQYFAELLGTPQQADDRLVYFGGTTLAEAYDRLGTTMLDREASRAIFSDKNRLHRDVLADETAKYLKSRIAELESGPA